MFHYRRKSELAELMTQYNDIFDRASFALPVANEPVCKGFDRGPENIDWLQRIPKHVQARGVSLKEVQMKTPLLHFEIGDVLLKSVHSSYSTDMKSNLERYATPAQSLTKATVFMIENARSRFVDPISMVRFLNPDFSESECHIEKDAELRLTEVKRNTRGFAATQDGECDTYVFSLVSNFDKLTPVGICNIYLPWIRLKNAKKLRDAAPPDGFSCVKDFMESVKNVLGLSNEARKKIEQALKEQVSSGTLSFGSKIVTLPPPSSPPPTKQGEAAETPKTKLKSKEMLRAVPAESALPREFSIPALYPLLYLLSIVPRGKFWAGSGRKFWEGGLLPRGVCPDAAQNPERFMVYTFKQLLRARYHDGDGYRCIHEDTPSDQLHLLLEEAETVHVRTSRVSTKER